MKTPKQYQFIIQLGRALHIYGVPSYKIQIYLTEVAKTKGIRGSFMDTPTWINYVFYSENEDESYNHIESVSPGELNLGALSRSVEITDHVLNDTIDFDEASVQLRMVYIESKKVNHLILALAFAFGAGSFSLLLGTNWISCFVACLMGLVVYTFTYLSAKSEFVNNTLEALAAFVVTILIGLLSLWLPNINIPLTILSAIIIFIPGLALTTALEEITYKSLVSGTAKLFDAGVSLFKQFFGTILGLSVLPLFIDININTVVSDMPIWSKYLGIPLLAVCLLPIFQVRRKDMIYGILTCIISYSVTVLLSFTGILISTFIGSITVVLVSHLFSHITRSPRHVFITQGIIMLVPGSKAFMGISTVFLGSPIESAGNLGSQVAYILMGVVGGLLFTGSFNTK
ncbi:threonine/serine exporter ThrE family protein [Ancylomarina sp. 16SWW S1-10-2]|uniref:threonine/serine ThrE exporter family protein n=1 Tax=Ancylomarina sp. 16SWW S1-10-2 TaxID=2499681 RepID=UPI0012ADD62A|nr:threonine/serine exporter family protein [Ancylomarina sp. 16SWW S1-10-2]MRT94370.1 threonine/serine exporter family protein [Ancylomarina sp. 16SWW S1-10-2]